MQQHSMHCLINWQACKTHVTKLLCLGCTLMCLASCSSVSEERAVVEDYLWRVSNVLDVDHQIKEQGIIYYPSKRDLSQTFPEHTIDLLDFLAMTGCELQITTANKNSVLGKVMPFSQLFLYQKAFIEQSAECLAHLKNTNEELHAQLQIAVDQKKQHLKRYAWQAIWAGPEMRTQFGATQQWLSKDTAVLWPVESVRLFQAVLEYSSNASLSTSNNKGQSIEEEQLLNSSSFDEAFEQALSGIYSSELGGQMLMTLQQLTELLNTGSLLLASPSAKRLCEGGKPKRSEAVILQTVFLKFYIGKVQPYLAYVHKSADQWLEQAGSLAELSSPYSPEVFNDFVTNYLSKNDDQSLWMQYQQAVNQHTLAWQTILKECGMMPSA